MPLPDRSLFAKSRSTALILWLVAFACALTGGLVISSESSLFLGRCLLIAAILLGGIAAAVSTAPEAPEEESSGPDGALAPAPRWTRSAISLVAVGTALVAGCALAVSSNNAHSTALAIWIIGLAAVLAGLRSANVPSSTQTRKRTLGPGWAFGIVALAALLLRIPNLVSVPPDVHGDEAEIGMQARAILDGGPIFNFGWFDVPGLSFAIPAPFVKVFTNDLYALRATSVLLSLGAIFLLHALVARMWGARVAFLAAFFMAIAQWNIHFSRTGSHYMQAQFAILLALYLLVLAVDTKRYVHFAATGMAIGLCLNVYYAGRLIIFLVPVLLVHKALFDRAFIKTYWRRVLALPFGLALFLTPMAPALLDSPDALMSRSSDVSVFTPENLEHERVVLGNVDLPEVLALHTRDTLEAFHLRGERSTQYGERGPLMDPWMGALLPLGLFYMLGLRDRRRVLLAMWVGSSLISIIITIDAPFGPRMIVLIPPVMVLCALGLDTFLRTLESFNVSRYLLVGGMMTLLLLSTQWNYQSYFSSFVKKEMPAGFFTELAGFIDRNGRDNRYILFGSPIRRIDYVTVSFLVPWADRVDLGSEILAARLTDVPQGAGVVFFVDALLENSADHVNRLRELYPKAEEQVITDTVGTPLFLSYSVPPDEASLGSRFEEPLRSQS